MHRMLCCLLAALSLALPPARAFDLGLDDRHQTILVGDTLRRYDVHVPPQYKGERVPLVLVLHGGLGSALTAKIESGASARADKHNLIVAYPQGTAQLAGHFFMWNAGACCGVAADRHVDDVAFIKALIEQLCADYNIDADRVYVAGMSNGGMLAYRLASELSDTIAAVASVEGSIVSPLSKPTTPVSVIALHGTGDRVLPYEGGQGNLLGYKINSLPVHDAVDFWVNANDCTERQKEDLEPGVLKQTFSNGKPGAEVSLYTFDGGHAWATAPSALLFVKRPRGHWSTTDTVCDFFLSHPKAAAPQL